ncbi:TPR-like protein [Hypoxylon sp. FL1150]|nr:TPR-like protein [Hypoxylon sp. FL1150]
MPLRQLHPDPQADVAEATPPTVDLVAVHGLNPRNKDKKEHAWDTWRSPPGPKGHLWLRDSLPKTLPDSRIFLYEYNATVVYGNDRTTFLDKANDLLEAIRIERDDAKSRPIIFLGHSMGGLLIKQALINAHNHADPKYKSIKEATSGLVFFATPHNGGDQMLVTLGGLAAKMARSLGFQKGENLVKVLESGNMFSDIMSEHFRHQLLAYDIVSFWGASDNIVPREGARLRLPGDHEKIVTLEADHSGVCKFGGSETDQDNLKLVRANLKDLHQKALRKCDLKTDRDASSALPDKQRPSSHYISLARNQRFSGRAAILSDLKQRFFVRKECQKLAVFGLGGVGKTQVALQFAYWVKDNKPDYSVFWVPVVSKASFDQAYAELAYRLSIPIEEEQDPKESVRRYLSLESTGKWLLIIDNADNSELLFGSFDEPGGINGYLPQSNNGLILFTTRSREVAISAAGSDVIDLHEMNLEEATTFLGKTLTNKKLSEDETMVNELLQELTYLPLAITQAAAYLNRNQMTIEKYLALLRSTEQGMVSLMSREFQDNTRYPGSQNAVATTWLVSFDEIRKSDPPAAYILSFISYIEPKAIPQSLLPQRWSDEEMEYAIGTLLGYAFLVRQEEGDMFDMHRLVHISIRVWLQGQQRTTQPDNLAKDESPHQTNPLIVETLQHIVLVFPNHHEENRKLWRQYLPHALRILERSSELEIDERYELFYSIGRCLYKDRRFTEAAKAFEETYTWRKEHAYHDTNDQMTLEDWLAGAYQNTGRNKQAIEIFERIAIRRKTLPENNQDRLLSEWQLATAYRDDERIKEAIEILERVVAIERRTLVEEDNNRLASERNLAIAYLNDGRIKEAIEMIERIVAIQRRTLVEEDNNRIASEHVLAMAYQDDGRIKEAIEILERVVAIEKRTLEEEDNSRLTSEYNLAWVYLENNEVQEAIARFEHVVAIWRKTMPEEDYKRLRSEHELARSYLEDGRVQEAIILLKHVVAVRAKTLTVDDSERVASQDLLAEARRML